MVSAAALALIPVPGEARSPADEIAVCVSYRSARAGRAIPPAADGAVAIATAREQLPKALAGIVVEQPRDILELERIRADQMTMAAIAAGDGQAFARLVSEMSPLILRFARSVLDAAPDDADEVVQETLVRLWQNADSWQPTGRISTWLHKVAYRLCIDVHRRRRPVVPIDDVAELLRDRAPLPSVRLVQLDEVRAIRAAIAALPARQRVAIVLCHFQGLNQADGAAVMGVGEHAYESLLARARRNLRAALSNGRATP